MPQALADDGESAHPPLSRRARKKERTRRGIYTAATALFAARSFDEVTIEEICENADVAKATFFLHFPSKAALLFEYGRMVADEVAEKLAAGSDSAAARFRTVAAVLCERWLQQREVMRRMLGELLSDPTAWRQVHSEGRDLTQLIAEIVENGQASGEFRRNIAPRLAAAVFLSSCLSVLAVPDRPGERRSPEKIRDQLIDVVLNGLVDSTSGCEE